jgi:hypothetical protein
MPLNLTSICQVNLTYASEKQHHSPSQNFIFPTQPNLPHSASIINSLPRPCSPSGFLSLSLDCVNKTHSSISGLSRLPLWLCSSLRPVLSISCTHPSFHPALDLHGIRLSAPVLLLWLCSSHPLRSFLCDFLKTRLGSPLICSHVTSKCSSHWIIIDHPKSA